MAVLGVFVFAFAACDNSVIPPTRVSSPSPATATYTAAPGPVESGTVSSILADVPDLPTPTAVPSPEGVDAQAAVQIYAQVVTALLGKSSPPYVYISPYVGQGEQLDDADQTNAIPQKILSVLPISNGHPVYGIEDFASAVGPLD